MSTYSATIRWERGNQPFTDNRYSRVHRWAFDGGVELQASASPQIVPAPMADPAAVDPEEAFVAALASCHMLFFLSFAAREGLVVDHYTDQPEGIMERRDGHTWMSRITLKPSVEFAVDTDHEIISRLHHQAHQACFLARSVRTRIEISGI